MDIEKEKLLFSDLGPAFRGISYNGTAGLRASYMQGDTFRSVLSDISPEEILKISPTEDAHFSMTSVVEAYREFLNRTGRHPALIFHAERSSVEGWLLGKGNTVGVSIPLTEWPSAITLQNPPDRSDVIKGKVALVTGAAQGFGWEIARGLAEAGAHVVIADLNSEGARSRAEELEAKNSGSEVPRGFAVPYHRGIGVDVTDESSLRSMVRTILDTYGGLDIVVSNAGVLKAGAVTELSFKDFEFVTRVNYCGFFLVTKNTAPILGMQNAAYSLFSSGTNHPLYDFDFYFTDIVEINSKSGLEGSNRNAAYAGSKFGGIGLVQSFALELVEHGIKVNALCPGNFLDGPLWSDPERGLFVQYLRAGKVPGAKTVEDVRKAYESKVPMKRGCTGIDVVRGLLYVVEQRYETGQAVPITGGQVMLR